MAERGRTWSDQEVAALMAKWADETIQAQLFGEACNVVPYRANADELRRQVALLTQKFSFCSMSLLLVTYRGKYDRSLCLPPKQSFAAGLQ